MQKNLYILKPYTKLSLQKNKLMPQCLRRKFEGWGGGGGCLCHIPPHHHPTPDTQMTQYHRHD